MHPFIRLLRILTLLTAMMLGACGFQLRGSHNQANLPFKTIFLGFPENSPLGNELKRNIRADGTTLIASEAKNADVVLELVSEAKERANQQLNSQGRIREYTLYYKLRFRVRDHQDKELLALTEILVKRDISFNESLVLAKEKEEEVLYRDMQSDLVQQIMRRLSALKP